MKPVLSCILAAAITTALPAADGTVLTPTDPIAVAVFQGAGGDTTKHSVVPVSGWTFPAAMRMQVLTPTDEDWKVNLLVPVEGAVTKGEMLELEFWIRAEVPDGGRAVVRVVHQRTSAPFRNAIEESPRLKPTWERKVVAYQAKQDWGAGESRIGFFVGTAVQTVEIAGIVLRRRTR